MRTPGDRTIQALGCGLLVAYVVQALAIEWPWLVQQQADDMYKVVTGFGLAIYLHAQWSVRKHRSLARHKLGGALAPLVLYLHASRFGYGYLMLLAVIYLGTALGGLLHAPVVQTRKRWLFTTWFVGHVATSVILVVVGGYHVVIALAYE